MGLYRTITKAQQATINRWERAHPQHIMAWGPHPDHGSVMMVVVYPQSSRYYMVNRSGTPSNEVMEDAIDPTAWRKVARVR